VLEVLAGSSISKKSSEDLVMQFLDVEGAVLSPCSLFVYYPFVQSELRPQSAPSNKKETSILCCDACESLYVCVSVNNY